MNKIRYEIFSGAGNDFVMIDNRDEKISINLQKEFTVRICRDHFPDIDGVIFVEQAGPENLRMNYYNRDGSSGAMCGNGARCTAMFALNNGITKSKTFVIDAAGKSYKAEISESGYITVFFPEPEEISLDIDINVDFGKGQKILNVDYINVGSDHVVVYLDNETNTEVLGTNELSRLDVNFYGKLIRFHHEFQPRGCNVNFVMPNGKNDLRIRTYERGVERETLACGTGVISSAISSVFRNKLTLPVKAEVQSGETLEVNFVYSHSRIMELSLKGSARKISEGMIEL
ncbi:MAG: diaminopimelate epimerase [Ignavibacteria bacterium]|nr:diaminopimelate epimerase [Ignavibacteria bacterium]